MWAISLHLLGMSSILGGITSSSPSKHATEGMGYSRCPCSAGDSGDCILQVLATPFLAGALTY